MSVQTKALVIKKFGWKRVCKNTQRFGWLLNDAVQHEETTVKTSYEGRIEGDNVIIDEHKSSSTKVTIHLSFYRNTDDFTNLFAVYPLELIYNIVFLARRIIGFFLPLFTIGVVLIAAIGRSDWLFSETNFGSLWGIAIAIWLGLIILESIIALIASKILKLR